MAASFRDDTEDLRVGEAAEPIADGVGGTEPPIS